MAVWSWNAALALIYGDSIVWKPSEKTPLTALAMVALFEKAVAEFGEVPEELSELLIGEVDIGNILSKTRELGGNNESIVAPSADLEAARKAGGIVHGANATW